METATTNTLQRRLKKLGACEEAREWAKPYKTASSAWRDCKRPDWMIWALKEVGFNNDSLLRKFSCWCARHTPLKDGRTTWDLLTDARSRTAVEVADRFADGQATNKELAAARDAAGDAAWAAAWDDARDAARAAAGAAARAAAGYAARDTAWAAAGDAAWAAARAAAGYAAWDAQAKALRKIVGDPFKTNRRKHLEE